MKFKIYTGKQKNKTKLSTERKQKIFAAAIFGVFFFGFAYLCVQEFPNINGIASEYQNEQNFVVKISTADMNKTIARNSQNSGIVVSNFDLTNKFNDVANMISKQISSLIPTIGIAHLSSIYQTEKYQRIITDHNRRLINIPQWNDAASKANQVIDLAKFTEKEDSSFFFVQMPSELSNSPDLPAGMFDNCTPQINFIVNKLNKTSEDKTHILDLRVDKHFKNKQITFSNDTLILPDISQITADVVAKETANHFPSLFARFPSGLKYEKKKLKNHFVGDFTATLGEHIVSKSDFNIILPATGGKYEVNVFDNSDRKTNSSNTFNGSMKEAVMDYQLFSTNSACPSGYLRQGEYCVDINNLSDEMDNDFRALIISDKQGLAFTTFFSQYVKHITFVDASILYTDRIPNLIKKGKYDAVYLVVADTSYTNTNFWKFDEE